MTQPTLQLNTNKNLASVKNITIRDSGNKEVLEAYFLNHEGQPYNLENKTVTFMENKDGDKFVSDPNVQIVNATAGFVRYTLQSQVHSASGIAWFEINDNSGLVDSTGNFNIRVENGLRATADNTTYIAALEKLKQQMEDLIKQADGELKAELQRAEQQLDQELQNFRNQYNSLSNDFQNQFKAAQAARQQDYNNQKSAINQDWTNNKNQIWGQWNDDKANIDKQAQDTIQAITDNAKQVLDKDQADWNAKQTSWNDTFSRIVKEWQIKTNSLNNTVQDLTNKFNTIIGQVSDLMNNKVPSLNSKTDEAQRKVDQLRSSLSQVDWTTFARKTDNSGGVNLLPNTSTFRLFSTGHYGDSDAHNGISIDPKNQYSSDANINLVKTKIAHVWGDKAKNAPLVIPGSVYLPAGTYTLSFLARTNGRDDSLIFHFGVFSDWTDNHGGAPLATSDAVNNKWGRHQITFSIPESYNHVTLRIQQNDDSDIPGGSLYFANLKLEAGSIATEWCQSYLDFDRLEGGQDPIDAPDFNIITATGIYMITQPDHGHNYPVANGGILKVDNAHDSRIEQTYYEDSNAAHIWHRQCIDGTWKPWKQMPNSDQVKSVIGQLADVINAKLPIEEGTINADLLVNAGNKIVYWRGNGDTVKNLPPMNNKKFFFAIKLFDNNWGSVTVIDQDGGYWINTANDSIWTGWRSIITNEHLKKLKFVKQSLDQNGNTFQDTKFVTQETDGTYKINIFDSDWTANKVEWLLENTKSYNIGANTNLNDIKAPGLYHCSGASNIANLPAGEDSWFNMVVNSDNWNGSQSLYATNQNQLYIRTWTDSSFKGWQRIANNGDLTNLVNAMTMFQKRIDPNTPKGSFNNQTVNINDLRETGIYRFANCHIQNGPYPTDSAHWIYLKVTVFDVNTVYQTLYEGDNMYGRKSSSPSDWGRWHRYLNEVI
ncbi:BppU family phage baseplate upper protein [Lactobacillus johnsonii]|uniref:BppU family phage baseplate upper protein n=1 Tax=Lactobacillus johnsonii TaxID=33959 RepID=UPI001FB39B3D|nr:BppU family phage baseplate upper protein [Lactobacillus johnsonii]UOC05427.1 BppU family phage baseplate upper protein [Lactobacillus johnsonii]